MKKGDAVLVRSGVNNIKAVIIASDGKGWYKVRFEEGYWKGQEYRYPEKDLLPLTADNTGCECGAVATYKSKCKPYMHAFWCKLYEDLK